MPSRSPTLERERGARHSAMMPVLRVLERHITKTATGSTQAPKSDALLLVVLDDVCRTHLGLARVLSELAERPALTQEVPALIELNL